MVCTCRIGWIWQKTTHLFLMLALTFDIGHVPCRICWIGRNGGIGCVPRQIQLQMPERD